MSETDTTNTTPRTELCIVDDMQAALRTLFGGVNALRHFAMSDEPVKGEELAMLTEVLDGAFYKLTDACDDIEAAREASKAEVEKLEARIAMLEEERKATPVGQIDSLKAWASLIRASASVALKQLDEMEGAV